METKPILARERGVTVKTYAGESRKKTKSGKSRRCKLYMAAYYVANERRRETFADLATAKRADKMLTAFWGLNQRFEP